MSANEKAVLEAAATAPMLDQTLAWSAVNSGTDNLAGVAEMGRLLADAYAALPGEVALLEAEPVERILADGRTETSQNGRNLHVRVRPDAPVQILLTGHMDTVYGAAHPFQTSRWIEPGTLLNGPGTADMKGGLAIILAALKAIEHDPVSQRMGYEVVINSDEETGSGGSIPLIRQAAAGKQAALTYEPALPDGMLAGARPGTGNFSFIVSGRSAHAGRNPEDGRNALVAAADLAVRLYALKRTGLSVNPAKIDGGGPNNIVPDKAILRLNLRPVGPDEQRDAEAAIARITDEVAKEHDVAIHRHGGFGRPPKPLDARAERLFNLVRDCGKALDLDIGWKPTGGVCDGNNIAACGVPVVDTMGARGDHIHSAEEYLIVDSLAERAQLSALVMLRLAEGKLP